MQKSDKGQLRKLALSKRNSLDEIFRNHAGELITARLLEHELPEKAEMIMCYKSFRSEVPTGLLMERLETMGKKLCFPVCSKNGIMHAWHPKSRDAWIAGMMGIAEPDRENSELVKPEDIDLVIVPMLAFDARCRRMGYGGGYYDRYLPQCTKALRIGIAFEHQRMDELITDEYDQALDMIITEEKVYKK